MTERDAFLADICEHPDEDAPRLVFADWLDDQGESTFAEFIRLQCALARTSADDPRRTRWQQREEELASTVGVQFAEIAALCDQVVYRRGFIEVIHILTEAFVQHREMLCRLAPVRLLRLIAVTSTDMEMLATVPELARPAVLQLPGSYRHAGCERFFRSPHLSNLRGLALNDTPIGMRGLVHLLESPAITRLTHLHLGATRIGDPGVEALATSPNCSQLLALDLRGNAINPASIRALNDSPYLGRLRRLGLWYNRLGDEGVEELVRLPLFGRLQHLSLGNNRLTGRGLELLANSPALSGIRSLWLGVDRFTADSLLTLVHSPHLHPTARIGVWLTDSISGHLQQEIRQILGERISFDSPGDAWDADPCVGWPLWSPRP